MRPLEAVVATLPCIPDRLLTVHALLFGRLGECLSGPVNAENPAPINRALEPAQGAID
jgi:hypothetical protein